MIKLNYTILYVNDVTKTITFYEQAFGLPRKFITPENDYGELLTGETTLAFVALGLAKTNLSGGFKASNTNEKPFGFNISFSSDDVPSTVAQALQAGAVQLEEIKVKPWGQTVAYLKDPDGFLIEICSPMG